MQRTIKVVLLLFLVILLMTACGNKVIDKPELILKIVDDTVVATEKAIEEKDLKLARQIWSEISEYGIKASEYDKKELSDSLGKLASTYTHLIDYLQEGDSNKLEEFQSGFSKAVEELRTTINEKYRNNEE